jgi:16S rRNA (adenine1518-N6/adenine1519-N6)-dimethyltransferase
MGQNFMVEPSIFPIMAEYASLDKNDVALDIGAGFGFLTHFLASKCKDVLAVEADNKLEKALHEHLADLANIQIIKGNVLKVQIPNFNKVVSIPPYQISSRLLVWLFNRKNFDCAVLIFQKEFANRLVASIGSEDYGWLTILAYYYVECELLDDVPRAMFYPQPEVDSIIVRLRLRQQKLFVLNAEALFTKLVQSLFTQRNRKVRNAVMPFLRGIRARTPEDAARIVVKLPFRDTRVRELSPEDFGVLANALCD